MLTLRFCAVIYLTITSRAHAQNALVIVGDDAGFETSVYGNHLLSTPGLRQLAQRGVTFDNAFTVVSSCSSSRATMLTGLPPHENGMYGLHQNEHHFQLLDHVHTLPLILKKQNIATGIIGKLHVGPPAKFPFDFQATESNNSIMQVGRNITHMLELYRKFLDQAANRTFFLYIGFHDTHRCHPSRGMGSFCERFGNGEPGMGSIADWTPESFDPNQVTVPYFIPDTPQSRADIAAQYTAVTRMDRGIELFLEELTNRGLLDQTLVIYVSDNGIPFPSGRTNLYDPGMREPLIVSHPHAKQKWNTRTGTLASTIDLVPTILDWYNITYPVTTVVDKKKKKKEKKKTKLTGISLLPYVTQDVARIAQNRSVIFGSQSLHEITMYYPIRIARTHRYKFMHNLNNRAPFPIDQDFYVSPTFQELLNRTHSDPHWHGWYKEIHDYYYRPEFELYDLITDPKELHNLANDRAYESVFKRLQAKLAHWMTVTHDPWLCMPHGVKEANVIHPGCYPLYNNHND